MGRIVSQLENLKEAAEYLLDHYSEFKIWVFDGDMGAGKTTLVSKLCEVLGCEERASSPTFSIVNEYFSNQNGTIFHFDFYRIESEEEALDIGVEEYFYSDAYCFLEWATKIPSLVPEKYVHLSIEILDENSRAINATTHG